MGSWPDGVPVPKPQRPEGITEWEWQTYMNSSYRSISPELKAKVHHAMGWKVGDVEAAEQIADKVTEALGKADAAPVDLARYRRVRELAHLMTRMGDMAGGLGEHADARVLWELGGKYKRMANELRADLPGAGDTSPQP